MTRQVVTRAFVILTMALVPRTLRAEPPRESGSASPVVLDRVVARFSAPEAGGVRAPRYVFERELAFEARLVALGDASFEPKAAVDGAEDVPAYRRHHLQAALERHIAEELLASLSISPKPTEAEILAQTDAARLMAERQARGSERFAAAAAAEQIGRLELRHLFRRRALASLYLDRMVAPMLDPPEFVLVRVHQNEPNPFSARPFAEVRAQVRDWYVGRELSAAVANYYQNARSRMRLELF